MPLDRALVDRLYMRARAERWQLTRDRFAEALEASAGRRPGAGAASERSTAQYLETLHLEDLALACACAAGAPQAWDHFITEHRPILYRAADALDPGGGAREIADSIYGELFGVKGGAQPPLSLFRYFHGRSSLATWLRAVLAQRYVDRVRSARRFGPLPDTDAEPAAPVSDADPDCPRLRDLVTRALSAVVAALVPRDRLRLACYYAQRLTLAETGRVLGEHEATVSRQLTRTRAALRRDIEERLRTEHHLSAEALARAFECAVEDPGALDLEQIVATVPVRKNSPGDRSEEEDGS